MSRKNKFMIFLAVLLLSGFTCISTVSYFVAQDSLSAEIAENALPLTSDNIYSEIQQDLLRPIFISSLMAHDTFVRDWVLAGENDPEKMVRYLREIQQRYGTITSFFVSNATRRYYHSTGVLKQVLRQDPQDRWYFDVAAMVDDYNINVDHDTADPQCMTIFINHKVYDYQGNYLGAIGVGLGVVSVKELIKTYQTRYGRTIFFTDRSGQVTLGGERFSSAHNLREIDGLSAFATRILTTPSQSLSYEGDHHTIYLNSRLVEDFDWYLIVLQENNPGEDRLLKTLLLNLIISLIITWVILLIASMTIGSYQSRLEKMATTDSLTGVANRQLFDFAFRQAHNTALRRHIPLTAVMLDIDYFKKINDTYGHPAGDQVLRVLGRLLEQAVRGEDAVFRWGGEEFLLLLLDCNRQQGAQLAERIRLAVEQSPVYRDHRPIHLTVSFGVAEMEEDETEDQLIERADAALYRAKQNGRNRVEVA